MSSRNVFSRLEKFIGSKYPKHIKNLLLHCGFESENALLTINEKSIEEIEQILNQNIDLLKLVLKDTTYIDRNGLLISAPFKFLLGHKSLILNIPKTIEEFNENKKKNKSVKEHSESINIENLRASLLLRFKSYKGKKNQNFSVTQDHFKKFTLKDKRAKVFVKCVNCAVYVPCSFDKSWNISNYIKHIASHERKLTAPATVRSPSRSPRDNRTDIASNIQPNIQTASEPSNQSVFQRAEEVASASILHTVFR